MNGGRRGARPDLRFREDGTFTIVQFTDLHWHNGEARDRRTSDLMSRILEAERPDLALFTGDLIHSLKCRDPIQSICGALAVASGSGIPWAAVFGNHDAEGNVTRRELQEAMSGVPGCLAQAGPGHVHGLSNYSIRLVDGGGDVRAALYGLDSGVTIGKSANGDDGIQISQISWLELEAAAMARENAGKPVPGLAFFHIPLPEYEEMWKTQVCVGRRRERISCPRVNHGIFKRLTERGEIIGTFCGHDHLNDFGGELRHTRMYYGRVSGYHAYARWLYPRGARVIRLHAEDDLRCFETWIRLHNGLKMV